MRLSQAVRTTLSLAMLLSLGLAARSHAADEWIEFPGGEGPGKGKHVVFVSGDDEYRSEEGMPQLAKILSQRHGFRCTVLFAIDPKDGTINPGIKDNIPGLEKLDSADLMVILARFRNLPDDQMKHIVDYVDSGKPIVALRTSTHAFDIKPGKTYSDWSWNNKKWDGGFGRQVLGETWVSHHGNHGKQSTRGLIAPDQRSNPIVRGIADGDIWGPTDVYTVKLPAPDGCAPLVMGQVLRGMKPDDAPAEGKPNDPMMPVAWTRTYVGKAGKPARIFTTTMGSSQDLLSAGLRRLLVNACYWAVGLEGAIPEVANVDIVGTYQPTPFGYNFTKGLRPADHAKLD
ncbi:ThuA domain-containing protein [Tundrisphaera sp. TA3]|uniref:ThuA domain-containing protein n=1 Tax=Tundrisphaera sp. TA3 TaxID=3435775 RepID=UPI003EB9F9EA